MRSIRWQVAWLALAIATPAGAFELTVRDALTGAPLQARVESDGASYFADGRARAYAIALPARVRVEADAHHAVDVTLVDDGMPTTILLDPLEEPSAYARLAQRALAAPRARWLQGYARDGLDGRAIVGARIEAEGHRATSDASGYFELELDPLDTEDVMTGRTTVHAHADGYADLERDGIARIAGVQRLLLAFGGDAPARGVVELGARDRVDGSVGAVDEAAAPIERASVPPVDAALAPSLVPPATIRVGYADAACTQSCCTGACTHSCVLPLETYVRRGLDSEWIASWNTQSLRAGSVAYRSYGAWRVAHPINANFDICSSACCQVNDAGTAASTDAAIARTPGILLTRNGNEAASAEYSAENNSWDDPADGLSCSNNDLSCGNGFAGTPASGWPCLADAVGAGHGCFGHGRGMSQWGTQRWAVDASARRWPWIVDHYYNDNANANGAGTGQRTAVMTSPLSLSAVTAVPSTTAAGATVQLSAAAHNAAGAAHGHLLIGASLHRSGAGYIDDPAGDVPSSLPTGDTTVARAFHIPAATPSGVYAVLLSLYLDVVENGAIGPGDLPLALVTATAAITIGGTDRIFADGFEASP
ncbi:MAG: SpoIID/LytB domain-containing protein [Dokdonella sp.]|uniref:carboxypeptidase-like regulatory domain-containing protein n=1 Tax=Dokdonella sp. TaxID=2291710 RepID=UPI003F7F2F74